MAPDFEKFMVFEVQIYPLAAYYAKAQIKYGSYLFRDRYENFSEDKSNHCVVDKTLISTVC